MCTFFAPDTACTLLKNFSDSHFCVCEVTWPSCQPLIIVNCYLPPSLDISPLLDKLHTIISILPHNNIIILGDFNFHSPCGIVKAQTTAKTLLEHFILENELTLVNTPQSLTTFDGAVGQSNVDITLFRLLDFRIQNWRVTNDICSSDHNLIIFDTVPLRINLTPSLSIDRLFFSKSSWKKIATTIRDFTPPSSPADIPAFINDLFSIASLNSTLRTSKSNSKILWTPELLNLRSQVLSKFAKNRNPLNLSKFRKARNSYCAALRKAKLQSWQNLLTSHKGVCGLAYPYSTNIPKPKAISGTSLVLGPIPDSSNFLLKCLLFSKIILCKFLDPQSF